MITDFKEIKVPLNLDKKSNYLADFSKLSWKINPEIKYLDIYIPKEKKLSGTTSLHSYSDVLK